MKTIVCWKFWRQAPFFHVSLQSTCTVYFEPSKNQGKTSSSAFLLPPTSCVPRERCHFFFYFPYPYEFNCKCAEHWIYCWQWLFKNSYYVHVFVTHCKRTNIHQISAFFLQNKLKFSYGQTDFGQIYDARAFVLMSSSIVNSNYEYMSNIEIHLAEIGIFWSRYEDWNSHKFMA